MSSKELVKQKLNKMKSIVSSVSVQDQFKNALGKHADLFTASMISLYSSDSYLQNCEPADVVKECLKAAILKLPIEKSLGFAYIIPYKKGKAKKGEIQKYDPQLQMGYKGRIQLAMRTGQVKTINDGPIYEGESIKVDRISGSIKITGEPKAGKLKAIGYFGYFELTNGYQKVEYWTKEEVIAHAKQYSQAYKSGAKIWTDEFDKMASKTVLSHILDKYAPKSIEFLMIGKNDEPEPEEKETVVVNPPPEKESKKESKKKEKQAAGGGEKGEEEEPDFS